MIGYDDYNKKDAYFNFLLIKATITTRSYTPPRLSTV